MFPARCPYLPLHTTEGRRSHPPWAVSHSHPDDPKVFHFRINLRKSDIGSSNSGIVSFTIAACEE